MKIGYLTSDIDPKTGWGRYASELIFGIKNLGHEVVILKERDDRQEGLPVLKKGRKLLLSALKIRKFLADCQIIHALDGYPFGLIAAISNLKLKKKLVITGVGTYAVAPLYNFLTAPLLKWAYKQANQVAAISNFTRSQILNKAKVRQIQVINPGFDFKKFYRPRLTASQEFILSVGALKERKGYHISIPAFAMAKKQLPHLKYYIVGNQKDTGYFSSLKRIAKEHQVANDVIFLNDISDEELAHWYASAKLFILTSINFDHHFEGYGLVFLEAAASGLPVVGTLNNGIGDVVQDNLNGFLVPQNDIQATARALIKILTNRELSSQFSQASYRWAKQNDSTQAIFAYLSLYERLVENN